MLCHLSLLICYRLRYWLCSRKSHISTNCFLGNWGRLYYYSKYLLPSPMGRLYISNWLILGLAMQIRMPFPSKMILSPFPINTNLGSMSSFSQWNVKGSNMWKLWARALKTHKWLCHILFALGHETGNVPKRNCAFIPGPRNMTGM